jgi:sn-glycerol 3-phosphate transport system permease protein
MFKIKKLKKLPEYLIKALVILVFIFPFYWMLSTAFKTYAEAIQVPPTLIPLTATLNNFIEAWNSGPFLVYTRNTIIVTLSAMIIQLIIMVPAAYGFAKFDFKGKGLLFSIVLLALMMPKQIIFIPVYLMMAKWNLLGTLLPQIIPFAADAFGIFLLRQYFMQVPEEIIEAAHLDNASEFQIMFKILLPMAKSALVTIMLFSFIGFWNSYFWPLIMTSSDAVRPLTMGISVLKDTEGIANWNVIMAGNTILVLPIIIVYIFASRQIVKAFCYSGIK